MFCFRVFLSYSFITSLLLRIFKGKVADVSCAVQCAHCQLADMTRLFTREEVSQHNSQNDAAIIIDNVIYDVTRFLEHHPGGVEVLLDNAGKDASRCFADVGHSDDAKLWRSEYKIGEVVENERWEVVGPTPTVEPASDELTLRGLISVWAPPVALAAVALIAYAFLFS